MASISFYFDEMMPRVPAEELTRHGYRVIVAADVGMVGKDDLSEQLPYATQHELTLVTFDRKFAGLASQVSDHAGVICLSGSQDNFGYMIRTLTEIAEQFTAESIAVQVLWR